MTQAVTEVATRAMLLAKYLDLYNKLQEDCLLTQFGDRLCVPEVVGMFFGILQGLWQTLAHGEEMKGFLYLLLFLLWQRVQLAQQMKEQGRICLGTSSLPPTVKVISLSSNDQ